MLARKGSVDTNQLCLSRGIGLKVGVHAAVICDRFPIFLLTLAFSSNVLVRAFQRSGGMPAKFSSMSSSGTIENLSLQLFQALNGTERLAVQAYKLLSVCPNKKSAMVAQRTIALFEQTFYLLSVIWSVWITEQLQQL